MSFKYNFFYGLVMPPVKLFLKLKFGYTYEKAAGKALPENYIVLSNHVTDFDMLFVGASFKKQMFFVGSEHISRWKVYPLLKFAFAPIIRRKGTVAASTVTGILRKTRKGSNVCIFAEGIRSWSGLTSPILPSTGKLVKSAGCGLVTYKITGGYLTSPVWSEGSGTRRGPVHGAPVNIYTKEQIAAMSVEEINQIICRDLHEDAYARQLAAPKKYKGKNLAQKMENLLFICPECGGYDTFSSKGSTVRCSQCGFSFTYDCYGILKGAPFTTVTELYMWLRERAAEDAAAGRGYSSRHATLSVVENENDTLADEGELYMDGSVIRCGSTTISTDDVSTLDIHGKHSIVFAAGKTYYEINIDRDLNAYKYFLLFGAYRQAARQEPERVI